jgi:dihydrofolate reductase
MIRLIVAIDRKRGIAKHGYQPWYIPDDEAYFIRQSKSYGGNVLVGGTTFRDSFKSKPLSERTSLKDQDIWVVGGASVYTQVIDAGLADELYITHIDADFGCDQFFPEYESKFHLSSQNEPSEQNGFHFTYARYTRT